MKLVQGAMGAARARLVLQVLLVAVFALFAGTACAQDSQFAPVPDELSGEGRRGLESRRMLLLQQREAMLAKITGHNVKCSKVPENSPLVAECSGDQTTLTVEIRSYQNAVAEFNRLVNEKNPASPTGDPMVVDARVPRDGAYLIDQVPELKNSPAADRITKGYQAVINHDWPVALAWWQDALNRDPNNAALKRSVDLAQWMVDRRKAAAAGPVTPLGAAMHSATRGDNAGAIRQFELAKAENPAIASQADSMIAALRQRQAKDAKGAADASRQIKEQTRQIVDGLRETGMNRLSIGDEKGAQEAFRDADFFSMGLPSGEQRPSKLPASKSGKVNN